MHTKSSGVATSFVDFAAFFLPLAVRSASGRKAIPCAFPIMKKNMYAGTYNNQKHSFTKRRKSMPRNKRESLIYTVLMCFTMVLWMSIYNVTLHMGALNLTTIREAWIGFPIAYVFAMCMDWFVVSGPAKGFAFRFLVKPESPVLHKVIAVSCSMVVPMVIINSVGMVIFFNVFKSIFNTEDLKVASKVSLAMRTAERCTPYLGSVENDRKTAGKIIDIIMEEYHCQGAALIDDMKFLARSGAFSSIVLTENNYPRLLSATKTFKTTRISRVPLPEDGFYPLYKENVIISAPILLDEGKVLALVMLVKKNAYSYRADIEFVTGLANHFAMQMKIAKMEKQKEELRKAELRTLQSQINPHFLFNSLNTISYFCREKPEKARELLLALSSYFRNMLDDIDYMVMLDTELEHVKAYTMLEEARFEKRLSIEINADPEALKCCVPNLILQPIVENAVHHGAMQREKGVGKVIVNVKQEEKSTRIDVIDNGPGIDYRIIQSLYGGEKVEHTGIGMMNVQQRLIAIYGNGHGLQIVSSEEGTDVRMNIPCSVNAGAAQ